MWVMEETVKVLFWGFLGNLRRKGKKMTKRSTEIH
jgi:hypothetical protein